MIAIGLFWTPWESPSARGLCFAANVLPVIASLRGAGITDLRGLAAALNAHGIPTARGGKWHVSNVMNRIARGGAAT